MNGTVLMGLALGCLALGAVFWPYGRMPVGVILLRLGVLLLMLGSSVVGFLATFELEAGRERGVFQIIYGGLGLLSLASLVVGVQSVRRLRMRTHEAPVQDSEVHE